MNKKFLTAAILASIGFGAHAGTTLYENNGSKVNFGGDLEFDVDMQENENDSDLAFGGRILIQIDGEHVTSAGNYAGFKIQPLVNVNSTDAAGIDDAYFAIGKKGTWNFQLGRFEAYDMFALGQDTVVGYAGNGGDGVGSAYKDNGNYIYMMKAMRGRSDSGQALVNYTTGNWYMELSTVMDALPSDKAGNDDIALRPVVAYKVSDALTVAAGAEVVVSGTDLAEDAVGYGLTAKYNKQGVAANLSIAHAEANNARGELFKQDKEFTTVNANITANNFGAGYTYSINEKEGVFNDREQETNTVYASYLIDAPMDVKDLDIYLGAYYSHAEKFDGSDDDEAGARIRFKYFY